jgi:hypothetical protein
MDGDPVADEPRVGDRARSPDIATTLRRSAALSLAAC